MEKKDNDIKEDSTKHQNVIVCQGNSDENPEISLLKLINCGADKDCERTLWNARNEIRQERVLLEEEKRSERAHLTAKWSREFAKQLSKLEGEKVKEEKQRQLLRINSIELRKLETQIQSAYNAKALQNQLREREVTLAEVKSQELQQDRMMIDWFPSHTSDNSNDFSQARERKKLYLRDLQDQLQKNRQSRQKKADVERELSEEIRKDYENEEKKERRQKLEMMKKLQVEREAFLREREIWRSKEKEVIDEENRRIERAIAEKEKQKEESNDTKVTRSTAREKMIDELAKRMFDEEIEKRELEDILNIVHEEEERSLIQEKLKNDRLMKRCVAKELLKDMLKQKEIIAEKKMQDAANDRAFAQYLAEQDRISAKLEREKGEAIRKRDVLYGEDLKGAIKDKESLRAEEIRREEAENQDYEDAEMQKNREISEERFRILEIHAPRLEGFLKLR